MTTATNWCSPSSRRRVAVAVALAVAVAVSTAVFFHAHPDDEVLFTGGTIARAAAEGHRVVLVTATRGEQGHDLAGVVGASESLGARREAELRASAARLGVERLELLGYRDSGMDGAAADGFVQAPAAEAAARLAGILAEEAAAVLVTYDERGVYGHPDHLKVHQVGLRAAQLSDVGSVFLATVDRDQLQALLRLARSLGLDVDDVTLEWAVDAGVAAERITATVDVGDFAETKREAMAAHQTQFPPSAGVLQLSPSSFQHVFGTEWFIELGATGRRSWLW